MKISKYLRQKTALALLVPTLLIGQRSSAMTLATNGGNDAVGLAAMSGGLAAVSIGLATETITFLPGSGMWIAGKLIEPERVASGSGEALSSAMENVVKEASKDPKLTVVLKAGKNVLQIKPAAVGTAAASEQVGAFLKSNGYIEVRQGKWVQLSNQLKKFGKGLVVAPLIVTVVGGASMALGAELPTDIPAQAIQQTDHKSVTSGTSAQDGSLGTLLPNAGLAD